MGKRKKGGEGKTVWLSREAIELIENFRSRRRPIPSFSEAVDEIVREYLSRSEEAKKMEAQII